MTVHIAPLYVAVLALMFVGLSTRTLLLRRRLNIPVGDAGDPAMLRAMRVHANFAEYVPLGLLILFFVEAGGAPAALVHALGLCLLVGRGVHAYGVSQVRERYGFRTLGMVLTFTTLIMGSGYLLRAYAGGA